MSAMMNTGKTTVKDTVEQCGFETLNKKELPNRDIASVYCCDLLSVVMGKAPADSAWVTVMGNLNVVAVSALADTACVIVADSSDVEERAIEKADQQGIHLLRSTLPVFETAKLVDGLLA